MTFHDSILQGFAALPPWAQNTVQAAIVVLAGVLVLKVFDNRIEAAVRRAPNLDETALRFLIRVVDIAGWVIVLVWVLAIYGVNPTALMGGMAIGGFVIGFALKDALGNLAAGLMLLLYRPFNVGDTVTISGASGDVERLGMAMTVLKAADGRLVTLPNGGVLGGTIINHTREAKRRADVLVGIGYDDDIDTAVKAILDALGQDARVLADPAPSVRITDLGDNAVGLQVRPWVMTGDFWQAQADFHGVVKRALAAAGCSIPYPQRDVHVYEETRDTASS